MQSLKNIILLQTVIVIYTLSSVMSKEASKSQGNLTRFLFFFWNGICYSGGLCDIVATDYQAF